MSRIFKKDISLNKESIFKFFEERATRYDHTSPHTATLYQDKNPSLALERDSYEEKKIKPLLCVDKKSRVLDIGCGIGRWAEKIADEVEIYTGIDISPKLIEIARARVPNKNTQFHVANSEDLNSEKIKSRGPYDIVIMAGIMIYLNDEPLFSTLNAVGSQMATGGKIYMREPLAVDQKLTLSDFWSDDLNQHYSAVYRTRGEMETIFEQTLYRNNFEKIEFLPLYEDPFLNNRQETIQHYALAKHKDKK